MTKSIRILAAAAGITLATSAELHAHGFLLSGINDVARSIGIGWSDGYHAAGSRVHHSHWGSHSLRPCSGPGCQTWHGAPVYDVYMEPIPVPVSARVGTAVEQTNRMH